MVLDAAIFLKKSLCHKLGAGQPSIQSLCVTHWNDEWAKDSMECVRGKVEEGLLSLSKESISPTKKTASNATMLNTLRARRGMNHFSADFLAVESKISREPSLCAERMVEGLPAISLATMAAKRSFTSVRNAKQGLPFISSVGSMQFCVDSILRQRAQR